MKSCLFIASLLVLVACGPKVRTFIVEERSPLETDAPILVLYTGEVVPRYTDFIAEVNVTDNGFSTNCNLDLVLDRAKRRARKAGGNVLKLTAHRLPEGRNYCHEIEAKVLYLDDQEMFKELYHRGYETELPADSAYALFFVYRTAGKNSLVKYDLHLGDSALVRVKPGMKDTLKIRKEGLNRLWSRTEVIEEIPIDVAFGKCYYIQCGLKTGWFVGRPTIQIVDPRTGALVFNSGETE